MWRLFRHMDVFVEICEWLCRGNWRDSSLRFGDRLWSRIRTLRFLILLCIITSSSFLISTPLLEYLSGIPEEIRLSTGEPRELVVGLPLDISLSVNEGKIIRLGTPDLKTNLAEQNDPSTIRVFRGQRLRIDPISPGATQLYVKFARILPARRVLVNVVPQLKVMAGGHAIGVLLAPQGVIVAGLYPVITEDGRRVHPVADAGIQVGDVILQVDGIDVQGTSHLETLINQAGLRGRPVELTLKRNGAQIKTMVTPVKSREDSPGDPKGNGFAYRIGVFVRDNAAGVGTLSFYDSETHTYGALGHIITDSGTNREANIKEGRIVPACIVGIHQGERGQPGEKIGTFDSLRQYLGTITKNTRLGIFGRLTRPPEPNPFFPNGIPVALAEDVTVGEADMFTVIDDEHIDRFKIQIERVLRNRSPGAKGLIIRITDQRLLGRTGGIVQGMSGSPIVQNGKLVAVVTHVFLADPTRGYATLAEWMLREAGLMGNTEKKASSRGAAFTVPPLAEGGLPMVV